MKSLVRVSNSVIGRHLSQNQHREECQSKIYDTENLHSEELDISGLPISVVGIYLASRYNLGMIPSRMDILAFIYVCPKLWRQHSEAPALGDLGRKPRRADRELVKPCIG